MTRWEPAPDMAPPDDHHTWMRPVPDDCPDCECCTARLCRQARERLVRCADLCTGGEAFGCPCPDRVEEETEATS